MGNDKLPAFLRNFIKSITDVSEEELNRYKKNPDTMENLGLVVTDEDIENIEDNEEIYINPIEKLDKSTDKFPISEYKAFQIANKNQNLKSDFYRNSDNNITYLSFDNCKINLKTIGEDTFWHIKITDGEMSWVELDYSLDDEIPNTIFCDGTFSDEDYELLQCLINVKTGEYKYFPKETL